MTDTEPNCPARLARFRLELGNDTPATPLPCVESIERPGRCVHCYQAIERAAGAPHGPYCTGDSRCRECARLLREARPAAPPPPGGEQWELSADLLTAWRADAARWARFGVMPAEETRIACQRIATLIAALLDARPPTAARRAPFSSTPIILETPIADVKIDPDRGVRFDLPDGYWGSLPPDKARALALQILDTWQKPPR